MTTVKAYALREWELLNGTWLIIKLHARHFKKQIKTQLLDTKPNNGTKHGHTRREFMDVGTKVKSSNGLDQRQLGGERYTKKNTHIEKWAS